MLNIDIDGEAVERECSSDARKAIYCDFGLSEGNHTVKITVVSGTFELDAVEYQ